MKRFKEMETATNETAGAPSPNRWRRIRTRVATHPYTLHAQSVLESWFEQPELFRRFVRDSQPGQAAICALLGVLVGAVTVLLHSIVMHLHHTFFLLKEDEHLSAMTDLSTTRVIFVPIIGGLALGLVALGFKKWRPRDVVDPIEANAILGGRMSFTDNFRLLAESIVSNAAGVSIGMEAAFTQLGSGIMSWVGQRFQLRREDLRIFVAAGSAAAISAAFNAPLAGAFYGFELVLSSYTIAALSPVAIAALASALFVRIFTNDEPIFSLPITISDIPMWNYPLFFVVGIGAALVSITTMKMVTKCEHLVRRLPVEDWLRPAMGGLALGILAIFVPQILGSGQGAIDQHFHEHWSLIVLLILLGAKMVASAITLGTGFRGGMFSASLFLGCLFGEICGIVANFILPQVEGQLEVFMLVGIGAVASCIIGAPVTMVLLVLEMTGNFQATTAVLLGVLVASAITRYFFGYSFSTWRFHLRGLRIQGAQDIGWISDITVSKLMRTDIKTVLDTTSLEDLRKIAPPGSLRRIFVKDNMDDYHGMIDINALHNPDLDNNLAGKTALDLAKGKEYFLTPYQDIQQILKRFDEAALEELPVLSASKVVGFVTEAYALRRYAQELEYRNLGRPTSATAKSSALATPDISLNDG